MALLEKFALGGLFAGLDLYGGAFVFKAKEEGAGVFEVLK